MYFVMAIRLEEGQVKNVLIPSHWCFGFNMESVYRSTTTDFKIFVSKTKSTIPNIDLPVDNTFTNADACYIARFKACKRKIVCCKQQFRKFDSKLVLIFFDKKDGLHSARSYQRKARNIWAMVYCLTKLGIVRPI